MTAEKIQAEAHGFEAPLDWAQQNKAGGFTTKTQGGAAAVAAGSSRSTSRYDRLIGPEPVEGLRPRAESRGP